MARRPLLLISLVVIPATLLAAARLLQISTPAADPTYSVQQSTATVHRPHRRRRHFKRLRAVGERMLTPNTGAPYRGVIPPSASQFPAMPPSPPPTPPPTPAERILRGVAKVMTHSWNDTIFVWLPAISTDPNSGPTYGILPVMVISDRIQHHIRHLIAPSYTYNSLFGQTVTGRYYFYPTDDSQLFTTASYSTNTNRTVK